MAIKKGTPNIFTNGTVLGKVEHNALLQETDKYTTSTNIIEKRDLPNQSKKEVETVEISIPRSKRKIVNKAETKQEFVIEGRAELKEKVGKVAVVHEKSPIQLTLKNQNKEKKQYATFYIRETTISLIAEYAGRGAGKARTGYDKSEFVDLMLVKAINALQLNEEVE